jgi:hypothetical protein
MRLWQDLTRSSLCLRNRRCTFPRGEKYFEQFFWSVGDGPLRVDEGKVLFSEALAR